MFSGQFFLQPCDISAVMTAAVEMRAGEDVVSGRHGDCVRTLSCQGLQLAAGTSSIRKGEGIVDKSAVTGQAHGDIEFLAADEGVDETPGAFKGQVMTGMDPDVGFEGVTKTIAEDHCV